MHNLSANPTNFSQRSMIRIQDARMHVKGRGREFWGKGGVCRIKSVFIV